MTKPIELSAYLRGVLLACAMFAASPSCFADVLGEYASQASSRPDGTESKAFVNILCNTKRTKQLVQQARQMGIRSPADLISAMRGLWCAVDMDDERRLKIIQRRIALPFEHFSSGHENVIKHIDDVQTTIGSLRFGELPAELDINVLSDGLEITFESPAQVDRWHMKLIKDRWQLQSMSLCDCEE